MLKKISMSVALLAAVCSGNSCADTTSPSNQFFYAGLMTGYANVDWSSVVSTDTATQFLSSGNPVSADGTGVLAGIDAGYQFNPYLSMEAEYIQLPDTQLIFLFDGYNQGTLVNSHLTMAALTFKVIAPLPQSQFSFFVDAGPAYQYQTNSIKSIGTWAPTFGGGLLYRINSHWQSEAAFQYAPGTGKSIEMPLLAYVPEVYAGTLKFDYIFN